MAKVDNIEATRAADPIDDDIHKGQVAVGRENLHGALPPHVSYEGGHRFDPLAQWSPEEEKAVVRKTDIRLLSWLCVMVCGVSKAIARYGVLTSPNACSFLDSSLIEET